MKCGTCGAELKEGAVFCETCGARQKTSKEVRKQEVMRKCNKSALAFAAIFFGLMSIIFIASGELDREPVMVVFLFIFLFLTGFCIYQYRKY